MASGKHVSGIMENREAHIILQVRQGQGRETKFQVIDKQGTASEGEPGYWVSRACLI